MGSLRLQAGDPARDFDFVAPWSSSKGFFETCGDQPAVLVFLRYLGCPVCRMEMARLKGEIGLFRKKDAAVFVVVQSPPETIAAASGPQDWPFALVCDPRGEIFRTYGVDPGNLFKYLHPAGLVAALRSVGQGFRHGRFEGRETQMPAAFVIDPGRIVTFAHYGRHVGDLPSPAMLAENVDGKS